MSEHNDKTIKALTSQKGLTLKGAGNHRRYYFTTYINKKREYFPLGSINDNPAVIQAKYEDYVRQYSHGFDRIAPLSKVWLERRARDVQEGLLTAKTLDQYRRHLKPEGRLRQTFGSKRIDDIKGSDIKRYLEAGARYSGNREIATLSAMCNWGREMGYIETNPALSITRNKEKPRDLYIENDEWQAVLKAQPQAVKDMMRLMYILGLRVQDILKLRFSDCKDHGIQIVESKTGKKVTILWSDDLRGIIEASRRRQPLGEYIIRREDGQPYKYRHFSAVYKENFPLHVRYFQLRDIRAKSATDRDNPDEAFKALGHSSKAITERHYLRDGSSRAGRTVAPLGYTPK